MTYAHGLACVEVGQSRNGERSAVSKPMMLCRHRVLLVRHGLKRLLLLLLLHRLFRHGLKRLLLLCGVFRHGLKRLLLLCRLLRHGVKRLLLLLFCRHRVQLLLRLRPPNTDQIQILHTSAPIATRSMCRVWGSESMLAQMV